MAKVTKGKPRAELRCEFAHILGGAIACGYCRDMGYSLPESVMTQGRERANGGRKGKAVDDYLSIVRCKGGYGSGEEPRHPIFSMFEYRIEPQWDEYVARIVRLPVDSKHLAMWRAKAGGASEIAQTDQMEAAIRERRTLIMLKLGYDNDEAVMRQVRAALRELDEADRKLQTAKAEAKAQPVPVDDDTMRVILKRYAAVYASSDPKTKNNLNRLLVGALGSMPTVKRIGELGKQPGITKGAEPIFRWPEMDVALEAAAV